MEEMLSTARILSLALPPGQRLQRAACVENISEVATGRLTVL